jgi:autotransporter translocation and assembly factor TamB
MRPGRFFGRLVLTIAAVLLLAVGVIWWIMSTESGSRRLVAFLLGRSPIGLEVADIRGSLGRQLYLIGVKYRSGALSAEIDSAMLDIKPSQLVRGRVLLEHVRMSGMRVVLPDSAPRDTAGTAQARQESPRPPVPVEIGEAVISGFELDAPGGISVREGKATLAGNLERYRFDLSGTVFAPQIDTARIHVGGTGTTGSVRLDSTSSARLLGARVIPVGTVIWYPSLAWDLEVAVDSMEPARLLPALAAFPGRISLQASTVGGIDSSGPNGTATLDSIAGTLRGRAIAGTATVRFRALVLEHLTTDLRWGAARIRSDGFVGDTLALHYDAEVADIGGFMRGGSGRLHLAGNASGSTSAPRIQADIRGSGIAAGPVAARALTGKADVNLAPRGPLDIVLVADSAVLGSRPFDQVTVTADGRRDAHRIRIRTIAPADTGTVLLSGGMEARAWRGTVDSLTVVSSVDRWSLIEPSALLVSAGLMRVDTLCVVADSVGGAGCATAEWRGAASWFALASLDSVPVSLLPLALPVTGELTGRLEARNTTAGLDASVSAILADSGQRTGTLEGTVTMPGYRLGKALDRQPVDAKVNARLERAGLLAPFIRADSVQGVVTADLRGSGTAQAPAIEGLVRADSVVAFFTDRRTVIGSAVLEPRLTLSRDRTMTGEVRLTARNVQGEEFRADTVVATLLSDAEGMRAKVGASIRNAGGDSVGGLRVDAFLPGYHQLRLPPSTQQMNVTVEATAADLSVWRPLIPGIDSLRGTGTLALEGSGPIGLPTVKGTLRVADAVALLSTGTEARGGLTGQVELNVARDGAMQGNLRVVPENVRLAAFPGDTVSMVRVRGGTLEIQAGAEGVHATLNGSLASAMDTAVAVFEASAALPDYRRVGSSLSRERMEATIKGRVDDFGFLPAFVGAIDSAAGTMTFDAALRGTVAEAHMSGEADVVDVMLRFPGAGITVGSINLTARGDDEGLITVRGSAKSGGGELEIEGTTPARPTSERPGLITVTGRDFLASNSDELRAMITPDLQVTLAGDTIAIRGQVEVPHAQIQLAEMPETAVRPSDDIVVVNEPGEDRERPIIANLRVVLGDDVTFEGFNFNASLGGAINLLDMPDHPTRATGTLVVEEGFYRAYGQDLTVTNGEIRFNGRLDNPGLNIRAQRTIQDTITVGVAMTGSLKEPDVRLYSSSPMAQTQTLSYIVTGGPVGGSGSSGNLVNKALSALGIGGSSQIVNALGEDIGLSSARIETEGDLQDAALVLGKYLSPKVYITYGVGLFDPVSTLRLRYILSSKFTLLAEAGRETSADAVVRIKK